MQAIVEAVGLQMKDLYPPAEDDGPYTREGRRLPRRSLGKSVAWYDYQDWEGRLVYQVVKRVDGAGRKDFVQRRPNGRGGWEYGLGQVRPVLFRLPVIFQRHEHPVLVAEGEKCVLALESMGLLATCNPGGTGMGWHDHYSEYLCGRRVVVLPDADEPGRRHADRVVGSLIRHGVRSVRVVDLYADRDDGADVADWIEAGGTRESLVDLIRQSPEWRCA